jgi:hypothetical protein
MTTRALLVLAIMLGAGAMAGAQSPSRVASGIPPWADSALVKAGVQGRYALTSGLNPDLRWGDFDGDGLLDVALAIVEPEGRRRGLVVIHRLDRSVHVVGAGQPLGNGKDELPALATWGVERLPSHRDALRVDGSGDVHGWIIWNGRAYVWVQDSE